MREKLIPGNGDKDCPHNGYGKKYCACDECDWFLCCFPEYGKYEGCENCNDKYCSRNRRSFIGIIDRILHIIKFRGTVQKCHGMKFKKHTE